MFNKRVKTQITRGVLMIIPIETYTICDFHGGGGSRPPAPSLWIRSCGISGSTLFAKAYKYSKEKRFY